MTTIQRPGKAENPEQRKETVERLLSEAAAWEPKQPPTDFVACAMEKRAKKDRASVQHRGGGAWWGIGTVGVAAASVLFTVTGKMPELGPMEKVPVPATTPSVVTSATPMPPLVGVNRNPKKTVTTPDKKTTLIEEKLAPRVADNADEEERPRRIRHWHRPARQTTSAVVSPKPQSAVAPVKPAGSETTEPEADKVTATPASEMYETDDGRVLLPVMLTHTSADGNEVTYTPAVVEMAYQPVDKIK